MLRDAGSGLNTYYLRPVANCPGTRSRSFEGRDNRLSKKGSERSEISKRFRRAGRRIFRIFGIKSFVKAGGFWWYRWHHDAGIGFSDSWEKQISDEILRPGKCFVDAGSHVGRWTVRASSFYDRLLAFEPDPRTNRVLRRNIARNHIQNVRVFQVALSSHRGKSMLFKYGPPANNSLRPLHVSGAQRNFGTLVPVRQLDDFTSYFATPMVLKIDVEGEELAVLQGGTHTIETFRPVIIVEVHFHDERMKIVEELTKCGYEITEKSVDLSNPLRIAYLVARPRS